MTVRARTTARQNRLVLAGLTLALALGGGCNVLDEMSESEPLPQKRPGEIPATVFVMNKITDTTGRQPGGWWSGCLHLHLQRPADDTDQARPKRVTCTLEFGFPIVSDAQGRMTRRKAQDAAADVTNRAKARVKIKGRMSTDICGELKKTALRMSKSARKGARVMSMCHTLGRVPEFSWP